MKRLSAWGGGLSAVLRQDHTGQDVSDDTRHGEMESPADTAAGVLGRAGGKERDGKEQGQQGTAHSVMGMVGIDRPPPAQAGKGHTGH